MMVIIENLHTPIFIEAIPSQDIDAGILLCESEKFFVDWQTQQQRHYYPVCKPVGNNQDCFVFVFFFGNLPEKFSKFPNLAAMLFA